MSITVGEPDDFVFDRRTIAGTKTGDRPGIDGGFVSVGPDNRVTGGRSSRDMTCNLAVLNRPGHRRKGFRRDVTPLWFELRKVDRAAVETRRSSGLEAIKRES